MRSSHQAIATWRTIAVAGGKISCARYKRPARGWVEAEAGDITWRLGRA